jgi:hypothetical protein
MPQPLSSKDASSFRQVVRHYENKQYKKGGLDDRIESLKVSGNVDSRRLTPFRLV